MARPARKKKAAARKPPARRKPPAAPKRRPAPPAARKAARGRKARKSAKKMPGKRRAAASKTPAAKRKPLPAKGLKPKRKAKAAKAKRKRPGPKKGQYFRLGPTGRKLGRPTKRTPEIEQEVLELLELGFAYTSAAGIVGVDPTTLKNWRTDSEPFSAACDLAIGRGKRMVVKKLLAKVRKGNLTAILAWLQARVPEFRTRDPYEELDSRPPRRIHLFLDDRKRSRDPDGEATGAPEEPGP